MKKICFLIGDLNNSGGTERVTTLIANALAQKNFQVSILSLTNGKQPFFDLVPSIKTYSLYTENISFKKNFFGAVWRIRKFVTQHQIDTLIVVDSISCIFTVPALFGLRVKHICWEHFYFNVNLGVKYRDVGRKWAAKYCDYVVTLTKRDKELWEQGIKNIKAKIIPISNPTPYENIDYVPSLEFKTVLAVGRLTYPKGFDLLIEAWVQVCAVNHDWKLCIVGSGEDEETLKAQAKKLGVYERIDFIPATKNIDLYYKTSSFFCLSSRFEGFGMVILEAMSFGIPVVSFDCDCGPSDLIVNNETGILVDHLNVHELGEALFKVMNSSQESYNNFSKKTFIKSKDFYLDKIVSNWLEIV